MLELAEHMVDGMVVIVGLLTCGSTNKYLVQGLAPRKSYSELGTLNHLECNLQ